MIISPFWIPITAMVGAFVFAIIQTIMKSRVRELEIRERIALIERGLVPPPEVDPRGFDRAMHRLERQQVRSGAGRHRRAGVTLIGIGLGLMVLIAFAGGEPGTAIGVGGFLAVIGIAFFINSLIDDRQEPPIGSGWTPPIPPSEPRPPARTD
jgi:Flp pilus assembly protein TadB